MPTDVNTLLILSVVLVAGVASGAVARRFKLPGVTGQILAGILLGPAALGLLGIEHAHHLQPIIDFALGLMAVSVGSHLQFARLRPARGRLAALLLLEVTLTPACVLLVVSLIPGTSWQLGVLLAAICISTAPATVLAIVRETRSRGMFVKTLVAAVALNNLMAIGLFEVAHAAARATLVTGETGFRTLLLPPLRELGASALLGGGIGVLLILLTRRVVRTDRLTAMSLIAILMTSGLADWLDVSVPLSCLVLGVTLGNLTPDREEIGHELLANLEYTIFAVFFTIAGLELDFSVLLPGGVLAAAVFAARMSGKIGAAWIAMRFAGGTDRLRRWLGPALIPQAGLAVGLMLLVTEDPHFGAMRSVFLAVVLAVVILNEVVGPVLLRTALRRSGDFGKDRARVLDFLHEENITTELRGPSKAEVVGQLVEIAIRSNRLELDPEAVKAAVMLREDEASTCLGEGLALPHARLEKLGRVVGALGICREGLALDTPDGHPVHAVALVLTPATMPERHLQILSAIAVAVGSDRGVRQQLYHAHSPAHAYELLHVEEESEDFNYFLDDDDSV